MIISGFLELLSEKGYEVKQGKYLAVRPQGMTRFRRCKTLGETCIHRKLLWSVLLRKILSFYQVQQNEEKQAAIVKCYGQKIPQGEDVRLAEKILCKALPDWKAEKEAIQSGMEV